MPLTVDWSVIVDGINCTSKFNPYVMDVEVQDLAGETSDTARILLSDDGHIIMPRKGASMVVQIMGVQVFTGTTTTPRYTCSKSSGGVLVVSATGVDLEGEAKQGQHFAKEDSTLGDYLQEFGKRAGLSVKVDEGLAGTKRPWWGPEGRDFLHEGQRLASELGATFKIQGNQAVFAKRGSGLSPSGQTVAGIEVKRPGNFLGCDIEVEVGREVFGGVKLSWFDRRKAQFIEKMMGIGGGSGATAVMRGQRADEDDATARGEGRIAEAEDEQGGGSVEIDIEPSARVEGSCTLSGIRAGVDGSYRIEGVTHALRPAQAGGATTSLDIKKPGDSVGEDNRTAGQ